MHTSPLVFLSMPIQFDHNEQFYRTTLEENALDYLIKLKEFCDKTIADISYWKWVIIASHGALYNFMLAALVRSDQSGIYYKDIRDTRGLIDFTKELKVIDFLKAYNWIKEPARMNKYVHSKFFTSLPENDQAMTELNNIFRNQFIHYKPLCWSIEIQKIREVIIGTLPVLNFLILDSGNILWHGNKPQDAALILSAITTELSNIWTR